MTEDQKVATFEIAGFVCGVGGAVIGIVLGARAVSADEWFIVAHVSVIMSLLTLGLLIAILSAYWKVTKQ